MSIASNVICSIVASAIYDVTKHTISRIKHGGVNLNKKEVEEFVIGKIGSEEKYTILCESGVCENFLNSPHFKDTLDNYAMYIVTGRAEKLLYESGLKKEYSSIINESDIIDFFANTLMDNYNKSMVLSKPSLSVLRDFFKDFLKLECEMVFDQLGKENFAAAIFMNRAFLSFENVMLEKIEEITTALSYSTHTKNAEQNIQFQERKTKYTELVKNNNRVAHIYLLDRFDFESFYVPPFLSCKNRPGMPFEHQPFFSPEEAIQNSKVRFDDWKYIFDSNNIVYVTGGAGYGKSLFLKKLINDYNELNVVDSDSYIIIYGELKMFFKKDSLIPISVIDFLQNSMIKETLLDKETLSHELIQYYLDNGRCIILLDALDEVEKEKRNEIHSKVINFFKTQNPNNKVCITSRSRGFLPEKDVQVFEIKSLDAAQINAYVDNIISLGKFDSNDRDAFLKQTEILVRKGFLNSFLVLSLLINIFKAELELPENKLELYQKCFEYIAYRRERKITGENYDWKLISGIMKDNTFVELANLCLPNNHDIHKSIIIDKLTEKYKGKYESESEVELAIDQFLKFCSDRTELFVPSSNEDCFKFFHRSFFEYFYSQYIFTRIENIDEIYIALSQFDVDSEVFELTLAMFKQKNEDKYQAILKYIISKINDSLLDPEQRVDAFNMFVLGLQVVDDEYFRSEFVSFIIKNSQFCIDYIDNIRNADLIISLIKSKEEYIKNVIDVYSARSRYEAISSFLFAFADYNEHLDRLIRKELILKIIHDDTGQFNTNAPLFLPDHFYLTVYFERYPARTVFKNMDTAYIKKICRSCNIPRKKENVLIEKYYLYAREEASHKKRIERMLFKSQEGGKNAGS